MNPPNLMADKQPASNGITPDWIVRGVLTKVGDMFDRLTGRGWKPSSSLATSELIERLKSLLDSEARDERPGCKFVPNNIKLKMQWDKFSTDSDESMRKLENELLAATVDHINDKRYFTHAPLVMEVKPDYFTPGVRLMVSFDKFADEEHEAAVNLAVPGATVENIDESVAPHRSERTFEANYVLNGVQKSKTLTLKKGIRLSVGRTKENDLSISDESVSKIHASLAVDDAGKLIVADTGSTNGTFVDDRRIAYGKAVVVGNGGKVKFGAIQVSFKPEHILMPEESLIKSSAAQPAQMISPAPALDRPLAGLPAPTEPSIPIDPPAPTEPAIDVTQAFDPAKEGDSI